MLSGQVVVLKKPYKFGDLIGSGGFSNVYSATSNDKSYAIKVLHSDNQGIPCLTEASIMMTFRHPYLNTALDVAVVDDILYIIQDRADCDLSDWIKNKDRPGSNQELATAVAWQIGNALDFLHREDYIHGDLKSSNILVYNSATKPVYKITDYNLSVHMDWKRTKDVCTDSYRPIEAWEGTEWDSSIDIWCLGAVLYHCRFRKHLFQAQGNSTHKRADRHLFLNALYHWETVYYKKRAGSPPKRHLYKKEYDAPEIESSVFKTDDPLNSLIVSCLHPAKEKRPKATEIIKNPIFGERSAVTGTTIRHYLLKPKDRSRMPSIIPLPPNVSIIQPKQHTDVPTLAEAIYNRYESYISSEENIDLVKEAVLMIAVKLMRNTAYSFDSQNLKKLFGIERDICRKLNFVLI